MEDDDDLILLECRVEATTHAIDSKYVGRTIVVRYYDRQGVVCKERPGLGLELKAGEAGKMDFFLRHGLKLTDVTKIVLDCE